MRIKLTILIPLVKHFFFSELYVKVPPPGFEPGATGSPLGRLRSVATPYESGALARLSYGGTNKIIP